MTSMRPCWSPDAKEYLRRRTRGCCPRASGDPVNTNQVSPLGGTTSTDVALLHHQLLLADNLGPASGLAFDVVAELLRRCRHRLEQLWCHEFFLERRIAQDLAHLGVDLHHDVARCAAGGGEPEPGAGFVAGHGLRHGGGV